MFTNLTIADFPESEVSEVTAFERGDYITVSSAVVFLKKSKDELLDLYQKGILKKVYRIKTRVYFSKSELAAVKEAALNQLPLDLHADKSTASTVDSAPVTVTTDTVEKKQNKTKGLKAVSSLLDIANSDIKSYASALSSDEARFLVSNYYIYQEMRKRSVQQAEALKKQFVPNVMLELTSGVFMESEKLVKKALGVYTDHHPMGNWMKQIYGIGPVISAGILANIDITRAPTAGAIWAYAGLDPHRPTGISRERLRNNPPEMLPNNMESFNKHVDTKKRYWNADVKRLAWIIGDLFRKFSKQPECLYGHYYLERKAYETAKNERGDYADYAALQLQWKDYGDNPTRALLEQGKLSPAHIDARARRHAVKLFLSHLHHVWYKQHYGVEPPKPFAISHLSHAHFIAPPFVKSEANTSDTADEDYDDGSGF
ncbi:transposase [Flavobacterium sp.]|jgi:hypothetical protein|uniref:transposase n=1 Tax=Flavobacterium sp. TaxID=239 RepID=UPI0037C0122A